MSISENIRNLRLENNYNQLEISQQLGISRTAYTNYENGRNPDIETLTKLADFYGISLDELVGRDYFKTKNIPYIKMDDIDQTAFSKLKKEDILYSSNDIHRNAWRPLVERIQSHKKLEYTLYLLRMVDAQETFDCLDDAIQIILKYVLKNIYRYMKNEDYDIREIIDLSADVFKCLKGLGNTIEKQFADKPTAVINEKYFNKEEYFDKETMRKYFKVYLDDIL
jgi:transcriptional regulator with XRE-family HTH domain